MTPSPVATVPTQVPARAAVGGPPAVQALNLVEPLPGFPGHRDYVLVAADALGRLYWLQSVAPDGPRFLAVAAASYFPDYAPALSAATCMELELVDPTDAQLYCVVTVPDGDASSATANLRAPLVVNVTRHRARQVVLADGTHPIGRALRR